MTTKSTKVSSAEKSMMKKADPDKSSPSSVGKAAKAPKASKKAATKPTAAEAKDRAIARHPYTTGRSKKVTPAKKAAAKKAYSERDPNQKVPAKKVVAKKSRGFSTNAKGEVRSKVVGKVPSAIQTAAQKRAQQEAERLAANTVPTANSISLTQTQYDGLQRMAQARGHSFKDESNRAINEHLERGGFL